MNDVLTMDHLDEPDLVALDFFVRLVTGVSLVALVLATAGVYALMSFTVARRTSEIGIRVALGAKPARIVISTFSRALAQVGLGLTLGSIAAAALVAAVGPEVSPDAGMRVAIATCLVSTIVVAGVTVMACAIPARRAEHSADRRAEDDIAAPALGRRLGQEARHEGTDTRRTDRSCRRPSWFVEHAGVCSCVFVLVCVFSCRRGSSLLDTTARSNA